MKILVQDTFFRRNATVFQLLQAMCQPEEWAEEGLNMHFLGSAARKRTLICLKPDNKNNWENG